MRGVVLAILAGACGCNGVFGIEPTELVSINPRTIRFDNAASKVDIIDLPVPIRLDPSRVIYDEVIDPRADLRFHDPVSDTDLPFEIEQWVPGGQSIVWVKVPHIAAGSTTDSIEMYYGVDAHGSEAPAGVWSDYGLVTHAMASRYQSAAGPVTATATGITFVDGGPLGTAFELGGTGVHRVAFTNTASVLAGAQNFTIELWLYADYASASAMSGEPSVIEQRLPVTNGRLFKIAGIEAVANFQIDLHFTSGAISYAPTFVAFRRWTHLLLTYDGQVLWIYRNGALADVGVDGNGPALAAADADLSLGTAIASSDGGVEGMLDEVRLSRVYRSDDWVQAQYQAMTGSFITFATAGMR